MGATTLLHSGFVMFPCEAFLPYAKITVTAIPESGRNTVTTFTTADLAIILPGDASAKALSLENAARAEQQMLAHQARLNDPNNLIDLSDDEVEQRIGKAWLITGDDWRYQTTSDLLIVHFFAGRVIAITPRGFDVAALARAFQGR